MALLLGAGCGRTALDTLPPGASGGMRGSRDASGAGGIPDAGSIADTGALDGAATTEGDAQKRAPWISKIVAGSYTACALKSDGTVKCWAAPESSATTIPSATQATDVAVIAGERQPSYSLNPNYRVWNDFCVAMQGGVSCNSGSDLTRIMDGDSISLSVGVQQTCAVLRAGEVRCYGWATDLDPIRKTIPAGSQKLIEIPGLSDAVQISAGDRLVCALLKDGTTTCFGDVRDDVFTGASLPRTMAVPAALDLSAADEHYCVVTTGGEVVCRGCFYNGVGGGPYFECAASDADLAALGNRPARQVRTSYTHRCVRLSDGAVRCWGNNDYGELGFTSTGAVWPSHDVDGLADVTDIAVGVHFSCALTATGEVYCWGGDIRISPPDKPNLRQITDL